MTGAEVLDIAKEAIFILLKIATPIMLIALFIGLIVALFQALTQIQEMTLSFIPKMIGIFVGLILLAGYIGSTLSTFATELFDKMANLQ